MRLIDTHAHLYLGQFDEDRGEMLQRALDKGVDKFFLPNIDSTSISAMLAMEEAYPEHCFAMMGLHPCSVKENYEEELAIVRQWLDERPFCAIGEMGIDLYWDKSFLTEQKEAFMIQAQWAKELGLPIVIHTREATDIAIDLVEQVKDERLSGIFHCFSGTPEQAQRIIALGFHLGIGGVLTFKNGGLDKALENIGLEHLVLETDAPYLAPAPFRGKRNESAYLSLVLEKLAAIKGLPPEEVARMTTANAEAIFSGTPALQ
jgi:TatD DNase family protein